jgi:pimeloyl-ACP methyl ester carboxylesterase
VPGAAWKTRPTYYIVGTEDRTIQPDLQRFLAKRMKAKVTEVASSHVPVLSQPRRVYEVIREAAEPCSNRPDRTSATQPRMSPTAPLEPQS